jgi:DNA-binding NtrC family response regulator
MGKSLSGFTDEAMETLSEYRWPGNVRELKNSIEHAAIVCPSGTIDEAHLPAFAGGELDGSDRIPTDSIMLPSTDLSLRSLEAVLVARVLEQTRWNISRAAEILGINRTTLYNKIRQHGLGERPGGARQPRASALVTTPEPE